MFLLALLGVHKHMGEKFILGLALGVAGALIFIFALGAFSSAGKTPSGDD